MDLRVRRETEDYLLADTEGIYYFKPGGPYTVILKLNFVLSSLECGAERNGSGTGRNSRTLSYRCKQDDSRYRVSW